MRKSPERAIATFFATDDFKIADCAINSCLWFLKNQTKIQLFEMNYNLFALIYNNFKIKLRLDLELFNEFEWKWLKHFDRLNKIWFKQPPVL